MKLSEIDKILTEYGLAGKVMPDFKGNIFVCLIRQNKDKIKHFVNELKKEYKVYKNMNVIDKETVSGMVKIRIKKGDER